MAADAGVLDSTSLRRSSWKDEVDDAALTANEGTEPDVPRLIAVDEESVLRETLEEDQRQAEGVSPRQEVLETLKLLLSGGVAGAVSKTATAPLARLTILYQVSLLYFFLWTPKDWTQKIMKCNASAGKRSTPPIFTSSVCQKQQPWGVFAPDGSRGRVSFSNPSRRVVVLVER